jgi:TPR repeat protein
MFDKQLNLNLNNVNSLNTQISLSQIIQSFNKIDIKEKEPTTQNIEIIFNVVDDLINLCFEEVNEGKEVIVIKQCVIDYINNHKLEIHELFDWLLNNQNDSNPIYLLGFFNYHGIIVNVNRLRAFNLYRKATNLGNIMAQYNITKMYIDGTGYNKNYNKALNCLKN